MWKYIFVLMITMTVIFLTFTQEHTKPEIPLEHFQVLNQKILPFNQVNKMISQEIVATLSREWGERSGIYYDRNFIRDTFDQFFVKLVDDGELVGFVGIDREYIKPFISHLYVVDKQRRQGYGGLLLAHGENYCGKIGYKTIYLWCESEMTPYYFHRGWIHVNGLISSLVGKVLLSKTL